jgi:hypothetical protein
LQNQWCVATLPPDEGLSSFFMTRSDCERTEDEIDKLLNDPETPMSPDRIWALAEALAEGNCEGAD